jgi:hypothetical protein
MSSLGGSVSSHEERDLHRWARNTFGIKIEPFFVRLQMVKYGSAVPEWTDFPLLLPHELLQTVFQQGAKAQELSLFGPPGVSGASEFWEFTGFEDEHKASGTPLLPINFHVDGIEVYRNTEYIAYSMQSLLSGQATVDVLDEKLLTCLLPFANLPGKLQMRAHRALAKVIGWSLRAAYTGIYPSLGPDGEPLTGSRAKAAGSKMDVRARLYGWKGDLKAGWEVHGFTQKYNCRYLCFRCKAVKLLKGNTPLQNKFIYKDFNPRALSRPRLF